MKNTWRIVAAGVLSFSFALGGCGGGGGDNGRGGSETDDISRDAGSAHLPSHQPSADPQTNGAPLTVPGLASQTTRAVSANGSALAPSPPLYLQGRQVRGLDNFKGSCFINAALQLVAHDDVLRKRVLHAHAAPEIHAFFARYDLADSDLTQAHADLVTYIRKAGHMPSGGGFTEAVLTMLGAGYDDMWLQELGAIVTRLGAGDRYFNISAVSDQLNRNLDRMPENDRIKHFVYYSGGHYLSYLRDGRGWIEVNDARVQAVDRTKVAGLSNRPLGAAEYSGIAFAAYQ